MTAARTQESGSSVHAASRESAAPGLDLVVLVGLVALHITVLLVLHAFSGDPAEDAAMLLRYAEHTAHGDGIVWNIGEAPIDGATDFLYMVLVAALHWSGIGLLAAARLLDVIGVLGTIVLAYGAGRRLLGQSRSVSAIGPLLIAVSPAALYTRVGFGAPFFGLAVACAAVSALAYTQSPTRRRAVVLGLACLFAALVRPEGVLLAALLILAALIAAGRWRPLLSGVVIGLVLPGLLYFALRWAYFGHPLPNPYYKKGAGQLHPDGLAASARVGVQWFAGAWLLYLLPLRRWPAHAREWAFHAVPVAGFAAIWLLVSSEMDYHYRFQYPLLVLLAVSLPALYRMSRGVSSGVGLRRPFAALLVAALAIEVLAVSATTVRSFRPDPYEPIADVGRALASSATAGELVATTEAGLIPLDSGWRSLDLWGLNDAQIAHHGLRLGYLAAADPTVVVLHEPTARHSRAPEYLVGWNAMIDTVHDFMDQRGGYQEADSWTLEGDEGNRYVVYVSAESSVREEVITAVRAALGD